MRTGVAILMLFLGGCAPFALRDESRTVHVKGSDSMLLLMQRLSDRYVSRHPGTTIVIEGGGSGAGIAALIDGTVDLCSSSRPLTPEEIRQMADRHGSLGVSMLCARDALAIVVHPSNPVRDLPLELLARIFRGEVTDWSAAGGAPMPIHPLRREANSGSGLYFMEHVLAGASFGPEVRTVAGARAMVSAVGADSAAIGFGTLAYTDHVRAVTINGIPLTPETVRSGTYPITRYLYLYSIHPPEGTAKAFVDWIVSPEGQQEVRSIGYIPLYDVE